MEGRQMKNILITGASGLIGRELTGILLAKGYNIIATDEQPSPFIGQPNFSFTQCSIVDKNVIQGLIDSTKIDMLVHLACTADNDFSNMITERELDISKNVDKYLYKAADAAGIQDIIIASTYQVYAPVKTREPIRETNEEKPQNFYGKMKLDSEKALVSTLKKSNTKFVIARLCPIYTRTFIDNLHSRIYDPKDMCAFLYGSGDYGFSFCCLYNFVDFVLGILNIGQGLNYPGIYNVCDTKPILAKDIIEFERTVHHLGPVMQRSGGSDAVKSAFALLGGSKSAKTDYRFLDLSTVTSNVSYDNTKGQRVSTFRWKLGNTR